MDINTLKETVIMPKLIESFGSSLGGIIAGNALIPTHKINDAQEKKKVFVETVCSHKRVVAMWGESEAQKLKREWMSL